MKKLILTRVRLPSRERGRILQDWVAKISYRTKHGTVTGAGLIIGSLILCPSHLVSGRGEVNIEYRNNTMTSGVIVCDDVGFGLSVIYPSYALRNNRFQSSTIINPGEVLQCVYHQEGGWKYHPLMVSSIIPHLKRVRMCNDPVQLPGKVGAVLFDREGNVMGMVIGQMLKDDRHYVAGGPVTILRFLQYLYSHHFIE
jgi:hypothetical protein